MWATRRWDKKATRWQHRSAIINCVCCYISLTWVVRYSTKMVLAVHKDNWLIAPYVLWDKYTHSSQGPLSLDRATSVCMPVTAWLAVNCRQLGPVTESVTVTTKLIISHHNWHWVHCRERSYVWESYGQLEVYVMRNISTVHTHTKIWSDWGWIIAFTRHLNGLEGPGGLSRHIPWGDVVLQYYTMLCSSVNMLQGFEPKTTPVDCHRINPCISPNHNWPCDLVLPDMISFSCALPLNTTWLKPSLSTFVSWDQVRSTFLPL